MRVETALEKYATQLTADGRSPHTIAQVQRHVLLLRHWMKATGRRDRVEHLTHEDLAAFLASDFVRLTRFGQPRKATSANILRSSVRTFFGYLHDADHLARDPARLVRLARCSAAPPRVLHKSDCDKLLATLKAADGSQAERDHMLFALMLGTGIRVGSALALTTDDVDLKLRELRLNTTKNDRPDVVYLSRQLRTHLRRYLRQISPGPLFPGPDGTALTRRTVQRNLNTWLRRAGISQTASPHCLRHSFAMQLYKRSGDLLIVQQALRHRHVSATTVYARASTAQLRRAIDCYRPMTQ